MLRKRQEQNRPAPVSGGFAAVNPFRFQKLAKTGRQSKAEPFIVRFLGMAGEMRDYVPAAPMACYSATFCF